MTQQYLITSALPYVNNVPHLGNLIGSTLSADFYARYCRLLGRKVLFVCGSDCYGTASEVKAREANTTPAELCKKYHAIHKQIYEWFNISFDIYGETTTPTHTQIVEQISKELDANNRLDTRIVQQLYCKECDTSLADRYVKGNCPYCGTVSKGDQCEASECGKIFNATAILDPVCAICGNVPELKESEHIFLKLDECQQKLSEWVDTQKGWTTNAMGITKGWLTKGLEPRCITRDLKWGTPVPHLLNKDWEKVFYVWYDAPIGYISITARERDDWQDWWQNPANTRLYQFMAKDNIPFHTVMFPALLSATSTDWTLVTNICATEYLTYNNQKFSKSNSVGIFGDTVQETGIPADYWRYYLATIRPERSDSNFDNEGFKLAINELSDKFGNLVHRVLSLIKKYNNGRPVYSETAETKYDETFVDTIEEYVVDYHKSFNSVKIVAAVKYALQIAQETNKYIYEQEPWRCKDLSRRSTICCIALTAVHTCSLLLSPVVPTIHENFCRFLQYNPAVTSLNLEEVHITDFYPLIDKTCLEKLNIRGSRNAAHSHEGNAKRF